MDKEDMDQTYNQDIDMEWATILGTLHTNGL